MNKKFCRFGRGGGRSGRGSGRGCGGIRILYLSFVLEMKTTLTTFDLNVEVLWTL